jgi:hypothetical protein
MESYYELDGEFRIQQGGVIPEGATVFETLEDFELAKAEPELPTPDWDGFNAEILADVPLNALLGAVLGLAPAVALGVPVSLGQVAKEGTASFAIAFTALCERGDATTEAREAWGVIAEAHNLPPDFVAIVRGA